MLPIKKAHLNAHLNAGVEHLWYMKYSLWENPLENCFIRETEHFIIHEQRCISLV